MTGDPEREARERLEALIAGMRSDGWSDQRIAVEAGVSRASVFRLRVGETMPTYSTALRIERLAGRIRRG